MNICKKKYSNSFPVFLLGWCWTELRQFSCWGAIWVWRWPFGAVLINSRQIRAETWTEGQIEALKRFSCGELRDWWKLRAVRSGDRRRGTEWSSLQSSGEAWKYIQFVITHNFSSLSLSLPLHFQDEAVCLLQGGLSHLSGVGYVGHVHSALLQRVQQVWRQKGERITRERRWVSNTTHIHTTPMIHTRS